MLLVALLALGGCSTPPASLVRTEYGDVRAPTERAARALAALYREERRWVESFLPDTRREPVAIWRFADPAESPNLLPGIAGVTLEAPVFGGWRIELPPDGSPNDLSHELVHALLGSSWRTLPPALEEGLAEWVSYHRHPWSGDRTRRRMQAASTAFAVTLDLTAPEGGILATRFRYSPPGPSWNLADLEACMADRDQGAWRNGIGTRYVAMLYSLSYLFVERLVERVGLDGLNALCRRAARDGHDHVPMPWLASAAGVDRENVQEALLGPPPSATDLLGAVLEDRQFDQAAEAFYARRAEAEETPSHFFAGLTLRVVTGAGHDVITDPRTPAFRDWAAARDAIWAR